MINNKQIHTLSVYVTNKPGVLARIAQTFSRRGYNIESLVVSPAIDGHFSRMTIGVSGEADDTFDDAVVKEMGLIKIAVSADERGEALQIAEHFGCKTVDLTETSMILQAVGDPAKIDALVEMIEKFKIIELVRTGKVLLARGAETT